MRSQFYAPKNCASLADDTLTQTAKRSAPAPNQIRRSASAPQGTQLNAYEVVSELATSSLCPLYSRFVLTKRLVMLRCPGERYWREKGHDMKSYRVQYDPRTEEEIANWRYLGPPQFGPSTRHKGLFIRIFKRFFGMSKHRNYPDGGFRKQERNAA